MITSSHALRLCLLVSLPAFAAKAAPADERINANVSNAPSSLEQRIRAEIATFKGKVNLFAKNLDSGASFGVGEDERVRTASTIKLAIMVEAFARVGEGKLNWNDELVLTKEKKVGGSGVLFEFHDGLKLTVRDAVNLMIVVSDNSATNLVLDLITCDAVNSRMDALGFTRTRVLRKAFGGGESQAASEAVNKPFGFGVTTPREMVTMLEKLEAGDLVSADASHAMIAILKRQQDHRGIARALAGVTIASKAGALDRLRSDVGIVYSKRGRIALAITCDAMPETIWSDENPGYLLLSRLASLLIDTVGK